MNPRPSGYEPSAKPTTHHRRGADLQPSRAVDFALAPARSRLIPPRGALRGSKLPRPSRPFRPSGSRPKPRRTTAVARQRAHLVAACCHGARAPDVRNRGRDTRRTAGRVRNPRRGPGGTSPPRLDAVGPATKPRALHKLAYMRPSLRASSVRHLNDPVDGTSARASSRDLGRGRYMVQCRRLSTRATPRRQAHRRGA